MQQTRATRGGAEVDADECSDPDHLTEEACGENQPAQVSCLHRPYRVREEAVALTETRSPQMAPVAAHSGDIEGAHHEEPRPGKGMPGFFVVEGRTLTWGEKGMRGYGFAIATVSS
jgi:hypothetical protein